MCSKLTYFTPCSSVFVVNFEHVIAGWDTKYSFFKSYLYSQSARTILMVPSRVNFDIVMKNSL